ncbi:MAG: MFS transporter [Acidimicrobiales bacterium]
MARPPRPDRRRPAADDGVEAGRDVEAVEPPTAPVTRTDGGGGPANKTHDPSVIRLFGTPAFFRLWLAQVVSSLGDWLGFVAVTAIAARIGGSSAGTAVSVVLAARLIPGFFLGPAAGVLIDRWDRKRVMVVCDIGRGLVLITLPFVDTLPGLVFASLLLEIMTLMWSPAKEASVPNLVRPEFLATANSLSLVAAYGTFPVGSALFAVLATAAGSLAGVHALDGLRITRESLAIYVDVLTFFGSALMISTLTLPRTRRPEHDGRIDFRSSFRELAEGARFIKESRLVRSVILGIGTGLIGGGMVVPLGPVMSKQVLGAGEAGFGLLLAALGFGVAAGMFAVAALQKRIPHERVFVAAVLGAGICQVLAASMGTINPALAFVSVMGVCAGAVYILGFTILQTNVADELRGRIFAVLYTLVRFCLLLAFTLAPILSQLLDELSDAVVGRELSLGGVSFFVPGVRLTLLLGGAIIVAAGVLAGLTLRVKPAVPS